MLLIIGLAAPATGSASPDAVFPLADIQPGMQGYGLTVFKGTVPDTFGVQVLGVQRNARAAGSVILVELSGQDLEANNAARGMSGSPVFFEGRFAGAVAFGWPGGLKPIVGLTPAEEMLALPDQPQADLAVADDDRSGLPGSLVSLLDPDSRGRHLAAAIFPSGESTGGIAFETAATSCSGDPAQAVFSIPPALASDWPDPADLADALFQRFSSGTGEADAFGWRPLPVGLMCHTLASGGSAGAAPTGAESGAAAGSSVGAPGAMVPGSACAVPLVVGDAQMAAIGTTAWVDQDRVYLMGHPVFMLGAVSLPLAAAEIFGTFPSRFSSFKMGTMGPLVGSVHHDLRAGLVGDLGRLPQLVPVRITLAAAPGREPADDARQYAFEVVRDPRMTPSLVFWCLYNSLLARQDDMSLQTVHYRMQTVWRDGSGRTESLDLDGAVSGPAGVGGLSQEFIPPLSILMANRHRPLELLEVEFQLTVSKPMATARIAACQAPETALPGETVPVAVTLEPRRGERTVIEQQLAVPAHLPAGRYRLLAANAKDLFALEAQRAAGRFSDNSMAATLELIRTPRSAAEMVVVLFAPSRGAVVDGRELADLPGSVRALLAEDGSGRVTPTVAGVVAIERHDTGQVLQGYVVRDLILQNASEPIREEGRP